MHKMLDDFIAERAQAFADKRAAVMTVEGRTIIVDLPSGQTSDDQFQADADDAVIGDAYRRTARIVSPDIARTYTLERAKRMPQATEDFDEALIDAREEVAALHLLENLQVLFDAAANNLSKAWFAKYRDRVKKLPHDRQEAYRQIIALSTDPQDVDLALPVSRFEPTKAREKDGTESDIPTWKQHLLCDEDGLYPSGFNDWEREVLAAETKREGFVFWYRNPDRPSQDSLGIAYTNGDVTKIVRPDFIFFAYEAGNVVADLVDPHSIHLADAVPKLRGLTRYAETHPGVFRRVEAIAEVGGKLRVLDLTRADVRRVLMEALSADALYRSALARDYP